MCKRKIAASFLTVVCALLFAACGSNAANGADAQEAAAIPRQKELASKAIVVYYSATGRTKEAAEAVAAAVRADIFALEPQEPISITVTKEAASCASTTTLRAIRLLCRRPPCALRMPMSYFLDTPFGGVMPRGWLRILSGTTILRARQLSRLRHRTLRPSAQVQSILLK